MDRQIPVNFPNNLIQIIGECVIMASSWCGWKQPMHILQIAPRVAHLLTQHAVSLRRSSPCFCVLLDKQDFCDACPLDDDNHQESERVKKNARDHFFAEMASWPEFRWDGRTTVSVHPDQVEPILNMLFTMLEKKS